LLEYNNEKTRRIEWESSKNCQGDGGVGNGGFALAWGTQPEKVKGAPKPAHFMEAEPA